jgi:hypothetical protein
VVGPDTVELATTQAADVISWERGKPPTRAVNDGKNSFLLLGARILSPPNETAWGTFRLGRAERGPYVRPRRRTSNRRPRGTSSWEANARCTGYWAGILGRDTGPGYWAGILGRDTGPGYWAKKDARSAARGFASPPSCLKSGAFASTVRRGWPSSTAVREQGASGSTGPTGPFSALMYSAAQGRAYASA